MPTFGIYTYMYINICIYIYTYILYLYIYIHTPVEICVATRENDHYGIRGNKRLRKSKSTAHEKRWEDQEPAEDVEDRHLRNMGGGEIRGRDLELGTVLKL